MRYTGVCADIASAHGGEKSRHRSIRSKLVLNLIVSFFST
jgi:hypothetical protein